MKPTIRAVFFAATLWMVAAGCSPAPPAAAPVVTNTVVPAVPPREIPLQLASWEEIEQTIAAQRGKVVVVDVWSTWCVPCLKEFPGLVRLHQQHADRVVCMSLNCNYAGIADEPPESAKAVVAPILEKQGATFQNMICTDTDEQLFTKLNAASIPIVRVYDQEGKLRKQFVNDDGEYGDEGFTYADHIAPLVESLLK